MVRNRSSNLTRRQQEVETHQHQEMIHDSDLRWYATKLSIAWGSRDDRGFSRDRYIGKALELQKVCRWHWQLEYRYCGSVGQSFLMTFEEVEVRIPFASGSQSFTSSKCDQNGEMKTRIRSGRRSFTPRRDPAKMIAQSEPGFSEPCQQWLGTLSGRLMSRHRRACSLETTYINSHFLGSLIIVVQVKSRYKLL